MTLATLNVCHGGRKRVASLLDFVIKTQADLVVLTEFRLNASGNRFADGLAKAGYGYQVDSSPAAKTNGVLIASQLPLSNYRRPLEGTNSHRVLEVDVAGITLGGVYFPNRQPKVGFWRNEFFPLAKRRVNERYLFIGDLNPGKHLIDEVGRAFFAPEYMDRMEEVGWIDTWRSLHPDEREYTWFSRPSSGFRVDHVWAAPSMADRIRNARHDQSPRLDRITDHAALVVELETR